LLSVIHVRCFIIPQINSNRNISFLFPDSSQACIYLVFFNKFYCFYLPQFTIGDSFLRDP